MKPPVSFRRGTWDLVLPPEFRSEDVLAFHGRDPQSRCERVEGSTLSKVVVLEGHPCWIQVTLEPGYARCKAEGRALPSLRNLEGLLGLHCDAAGFEAQAAHHPVLGPLVAQRPGLRIPQTFDPWEALVWAILGQQVNLAFAYALRRDLVSRAGQLAEPFSKAGDPPSDVAPTDPAPVLKSSAPPQEGAGQGPSAQCALIGHPDAHAIAALELEDLTALRLSRAKAGTLLRAAQAVAEGDLDLEALAKGNPGEAEARLRSLKGVGPWTARYVLMRGMGFPDAVPIGDAGLTLALQRAFGLDHRPGPSETEDLLAPLAPHRSLAVFHLWASLKGTPA